MSDIIIDRVTPALMPEIHTLGFDVYHNDVLVNLVETEQTAVVVQDVTNINVTVDSQVVTPVDVSSVISINKNYDYQQLAYEYSVTGNSNLCTVESGDIVETVFVEVVEPFNEVISMTIGDDDAQGRLVTASDVNLTKTGMYEIRAFVKYEVNAQIKIYFNVSPVAGLLRIITIKL